MTDKERGTGRARLREVVGPPAGPGDDEVAAARVRFVGMMSQLASWVPGGSWATQVGGPPPSAPKRR